jgi:hypothetical protein
MGVHGKDDQPAPGVVLLSDAPGASATAAPPAFGRSIARQPAFFIVGVMPPRFQLLQPADVLLPIGPWAATLPMGIGRGAGISHARLASGVDLSRAQAELDVISIACPAVPEGNHDVSAEAKPLPNTPCRTSGSRCWCSWRRSASCCSSRAPTSRTLLLARGRPEEGDGDFVRRLAQRRIAARGGERRLAVRRMLGRCS